MYVGNNLSAPILIGNQGEGALMYPGEGRGNMNFDLSGSGINQARYIQIVYLADEEVKHDAVVALYFEHSSNPMLTLNHWKFPLYGSILALSAIGILWIRRRRH